MDFRTLFSIHICSICLRFWGRWTHSISSAPPMSIGGRPRLLDVHRSPTKPILGGSKSQPSRLEGTVKIGKCYPTLRQRD